MVSKMSKAPKQFNRAAHYSVSNNTLKNSSSNHFWLPSTLTMKLQSTKSHGVSIPSRNRSFYCRMAFPNFVYLGATTGGDSNSSYKLQEPACMPRKGTRPDPTSRTKGFGSKMNSFSITLSACVDHNVMLRYHNTVTSSYYPTHIPC